MKRTIRRCVVIVSLLAVTLLISACGKEKKELQVGEHYYYPSSEAETETEKAELEKPFYLIISNDTIEEEIQLYNYENGLSYQYHYSLDTSFKNKYGGHSTAADFTVGRAVWIGDLDDNGRLIELGISDRVWEYANITRFKATPEEGKLKIADSLYSYGEDAFTFQEGCVVGLDVVSEDDVLYVVGIDKKILSVNVTTGHGTIELINTDLFEGSFLQLGNKIFVEITKDMTLEVQEGNYQLSVANDGWGGTTEVAVKRGETIQIDLDKIKGDGPKYGEIGFQLAVEGAELYLDGTKINLSEKQSIKYGRHLLKIVTESGDIWTKILYVNSAKATIFIDSDDLENTVDVTKPGTSDTQKPGDITDKRPLNNSNASENTSSGSKETENTSNSGIPEYLTDYLSTLSTIF